MVHNYTFFKKICLFYLQFTMTNHTFCLHCRQINVWNSECIIYQTRFLWHTESFSPSLSQAASWWSSKQTYTFLPCLCSWAFYNVRICKLQGVFDLVCRVCLTHYQYSLLGYTGLICCAGFLYEDGLALGLRIYHKHINHVCRFKSCRLLVYENTDIIG